MWDHFGSQALRSTETLNAENKILKEIISRQRKKLLLLARQISQIESKSKSKKQPREIPGTEIPPSKEPIELKSPTKPIEIESSKTSDVVCSEVEVKVTNGDSDMSEAGKTTNSSHGKDVKSFDTDVQKRTITAKKRANDEVLKTEQPPKKRRSSKKTNVDIEKLVCSKNNEKKNPTPLTKGSPPKIRRSSRTLRQKSPEIESKVPPIRNSTSGKKEIKPAEKQLKELVCRWQKKDGTGNSSLECAKTFGTMSAMQKHLQSHVPSWVSENASYICFWNGCKQNQKAFAGRMQLLTHFSKNHLF